MPLDNCQNPKCGKPLPTKRKLKTFCSYACRGQFRASEAISAHSGLSGAKNVRQNRALQSLKRQSTGQFTFARINSCTVRVDGANKRGVGWLMEVAWPGGARQRWVARVGNRASEPLSLEAAKRAAAALLRERGRAEPHDWIKELNAANEVDRAALAQERKQWPVNLMGGAARPGSMQLDGKLREAILNAELSPPDLELAQPLQGDDYPLEYHEDGFPELPQCLDRELGLAELRFRSRTSVNFQREFSSVLIRS